MDLNKVMIIGRLTRDPELRTTQSGINVCSISVATGFVYTSQQTGQKVENTEFHNVVLWRKLGEIAHQYLKKGTQVFIEGRLQTRSWEGQDGQKRYRTEIIADNMIMLGRPSTSSGSSTPSTSSGSSTAGSSYPASTSKPAASNKNEVVDQPSPTEELPTIQQDSPVQQESPSQQDSSAGENINVEDIPF